MGCPSLLQGIFLTQGSNLGLPPCMQILYHLNHQANPKCHMLCDYTYMTSLKLRNCKPGEWISGSHEFWRVGSEREVAVPIKGPPLGSCVDGSALHLDHLLSLCTADVLLVMMNYTADP